MAKLRIKVDGDKAARQVKVDVVIHFSRSHRIRSALTVALVRLASFVSPYGFEVTRGEDIPTEEEDTDGD